MSILRLTDANSSLDPILFANILSELKNRLIEMSSFNHFNPYLKPGPFVLLKLNLSFQDDINL